MLRAGSSATAVDALRRLKQRNNPAGLLLVNQRMPGMTGVEFLSQPMVDVFGDPDVKSTARLTPKDVDEVRLI